MFWFFGCEESGNLAPQPGIKPTPPALEDSVLIAGPPGKVPRLYFKVENQDQQLPFMEPYELPDT